MEKNQLLNFQKINGYIIITKNYFTKFGEIDIIAKDKEEYVFIEVKTRTTESYGKPIEAVNEDKQKHILKSTKHFIYKYNIENKYIRFDIIEIYINSKGTNINHIKNVFF